MFHIVKLGQPGLLVNILAPNINLWQNIFYFTSATRINKRMSHFFTDPSGNLGPINNRKKKPAGAFLLFVAAAVEFAPLAAK